MSPRTRSFIYRFLRPQDAWPQAIKTGVFNPWRMEAFQRGSAGGLGMGCVSCLLLLTLVVAVGCTGRSRRGDTMACVTPGTLICPVMLLTPNLRTDRLEMCRPSRFPSPSGHPASDWEQYNFPFAR